MRKIGSFMVMLMLLCALAFGQARTVTGTVRDADGNPVPFATVTETGTTNGTTADENGNFSITIQQNGRLSISASGFQGQSLTPSGSTQNITLRRGEGQLQEVVVTSLGIRRERRQLATSIQTINSDQLNTTGTGNPLSELNGKASGLTVINSSGTPGSGTYIRLRGVTSITGNNQPLMVVDGVPIDNSINNYDPTAETPDVSGANSNLTGGAQPSNRGIDINPNDIESVTLLKGPAATALYGIQAASGAIIITTKKGSEARGTNISFNSSFSADRVNKLPELQKRYSQGSEGQYLGPETGTSTSWGALIDTLSWDGIANEFDPHGNIVGRSSPLAKIPVTPYDRYDFFQTGLSYNNNIALSGGNERSNYRMSLGNVNQTGIIPKAEYDKTTFSLNGQTAINDKFIISGGANYIRSTNNRPQQGSNISGVMLGLLRTPPTFDNSNGRGDDAEDDPAAFVLSNGEQRNYRGGGGYDNPYWTVNRVLFKQDLNRLFGFGQASYQLADWINASWRIGGDVYSQDDKNSYDVKSRAFPAGAIYQVHYFNEQFNSDFNINMKKNLTKTLAGSLLLGHNYFTTTSRRTLAQGNGFVLPNFMDLSNITSYISSEQENRKRTMAFYGEAHLDYMERLFLTLTGRQETSSTLPEKNNNFFYPSVGLAYEFSKMPLFIGNKILTYGKLRASFAQVGKDAPIQGLETYFATSAVKDGFTTGIQFPINGNAGYQISSTNSVIGNPDLKAEKTNSYELGVDLGFWQNRVTLNATAYYSKSTDVILIVPIAYSTGFGNILQNAATITNKGLELTLNTTPVQTGDFRWDANFNWSRNVNKVVSLAEGIEKVLIAGFENGEVDAIAGQPFGAIHGSVYVRSDPNDMNSPLLINDDKTDPGYGMPILSSQNAAIGDINPEWVGSFINNLTYKGLNLNAQLDVRQGGDIWNGTRGALSFFGTSKETETRGETKVFKGVLGHLDEQGNVVHFGPDGVSEIAKGGAENTVPATLNEYYWQNIGSSFIGPAEPSVEKTSFVRIRQISLGYTFPNAVIQNTPFNNLSITLFANNPVLWTDYTGVDPETSLAGPANGQGLDYFNNPGTRSYGIRLNLGL